MKFFQNINNKKLLSCLLLFVFASSYVYAVNDIKDTDQKTVDQALQVIEAPKKPIQPPGAKSPPKDPSPPVLPPVNKLPPKEPLPPVIRPSKPIPIKPSKPLPVKSEELCPDQLVDKCNLENANGSQCSAMYSVKKAPQILEKGIGSLCESSPLGGCQASYGTCVIPALPIPPSMLPQPVGLPVPIPSIPQEQICPPNIYWSCSLTSSGAFLGDNPNCSDNLSYSVLIAPQGNKTGTGQICNAPFGGICVAGDISCIIPVGTVMPPPLQIYEGTPNSCSNSVSQCSRIKDGATCVNSYGVGSNACTWNSGVCSASDLKCGSSGGGKPLPPAALQQPFDASCPFGSNCNCNDFYATAIPDCSQYTPSLGNVCTEYFELSNVVFTTIGCWSTEGCNCAQNTAGTITGDCITGTVGCDSCSVPTGNSTGTWCGKNANGYCGKSELACN